MYIPWSKKAYTINYYDAARRCIHDLAAASNSRKHATGALLEKSISESTFAIQSSKEHLRCDESC